MRYSELLATFTRNLRAPGASRRMRRRASVSAPRSATGRRSPTPSTALGDLKQHFRLVILSNVDRASFQRRATAGRGVRCDVHRPGHRLLQADRRNFAYLIEHLAAMGLARRISCIPRRACSTTMRRPMRRGWRRRGSTGGRTRKAGVRRPRHRPACGMISGSPAWRRWRRRTRR